RAERHQLDELVRAARIVRIALRLREHEVIEARGQEMLDGARTARSALLAVVAVGYGMAARVLELRAHELGERCLQWSEARGVAFERDQCRHGRLERRETLGRGLAPDAIGAWRVGPERQPWEAAKPPVASDDLQRRDPRAVDDD